MCIICIDYQKGLLTAAEANRALGEMADDLGPEHVAEVLAMLDEAEPEARQETAPGDS